MYVRIHMNNHKIISFFLILNQLLNILEHIDKFFDAVANHKSSILSPINKNMKREIPPFQIFHMSLFIYSLAQKFSKMKGL